MELPAPPELLNALATYVRDRLAERLADVGESLVPLLRRSDVPVISSLGPPERTVAGSVRQVAGVVIAAAGPFAPTSYSRARLIRQLHASGLLSPDEAQRAATVLA